MKVLMLTWEYAPYFVGGLGIACKYLFPELMEKGISLDVVLPYGYHEAHNELGTSIYSTDSIALRNPLIDTTRAGGQVPLYPKNLVECINHYAHYMHTFVSNSSFDIIHAHDWMGFQAGMIAKKISGKPLIVHVHATAFNTHGGEDIDDDVYAIEYVGMHTADLVIAVSEMMKTIIINEYAIPPEKIVVIHNGMAPITYVDTPKSKNATPTVLFLGRLTKQKGPQYFLKMVQEIKRRRPEVRFIMAGTGTMEKLLHTQAEQLGIKDVVRFTGFLDQKQAYDMFHAADIFIMPSTSEPFGLTCLEALSCGTPVIISNQSGAAEVLDHCIKVDFWDIEAMVNAVLTLLDDAQLCETLVTNGIAQIKELTWERVAQNCVNVYKKAVGST